MTIERRAGLPPSHMLLALAVVAIWGTNFVIIKVALAHLPPLLLATLRFSFVVVPAIFVVRRPAVPWAKLAAYGLLIGAGQFGILFVAMRSAISPGLASLIIQTQVFFTIGMAMRAQGERPTAVQGFALLLATIGIGVILAHAEGDATPLGIALVLVAALCWAGGNMVARSTPTASMIGYVVWSSLFAVPPLLLLSLVTEGPAAMVAGLRAADTLTWASVLWQAVGNSLFGYTAWGWLLARHPAATVTPIALLVPLFGIGASALLLGEGLPGWKLLAAALVIGGLGINLFWPLIIHAGRARGLISRR